MRVNGEEVDTREWHLEGEESDRRGVAGRQGGEGAQRGGDRIRSTRGGRSL